jgi:hypothetical protein
MGMGYSTLGPFLFYRPAIPNYWKRSRAPVVIGIEGGKRYRRLFWRIFVRTNREFL